MLFNKTPIPKHWLVNSVKHWLFSLKLVSLFINYNKALHLFNVFQVKLTQAKLKMFLL
jgi:hypothetical protein